MSHRHTVKGSSLKTASDPNFAHPHKEGAIVESVQPAKDNIWGAYYFKHYSRSSNLLGEGFKAHKKTVKLLAKIHALPLGKTNTRYVPDKIRDELEFASREFLHYTKTGLDYLASELLQSINNIRSIVHGLPQYDWDNLEVLDKFKLLLKEIKLSQVIPSKVIDLINRRDIAEHPTSKRLYNAGASEWKNVHLAWVLSGEIEPMLKEVVDFANSVWKAFEEYRKKYDGPVTLTGVQRGIKSIDFSKKPPSSK